MVTRGALYAMVRLVTMRDGTYKILIRGQDDFGLERIVRGYETALMMFDALREASIEKLEAMGYVRA